MKSRFVNSSQLEARGVDLKDVLQGDQAEVVKNEDNFNWLVAQAEGMYRDKFGVLPDRDDPAHFAKWTHKELFNLVFACAKEGLSKNPSEFQN